MERSPLFDCITWRNGVPATLTSIPTKSIKGEIDPLLEPYNIPIGKCNSRSGRKNRITRYLGGVYVFHNEVVNKDSVFINDLVIDHQDGGWAYITDKVSKFPGIIVFSLRVDRTSWKVTHQSMQATEEEFVVNVTEFKLRSPVNGIALSPACMKGDRILYYTPLSSYENFAVPVSILKSGRNVNIDSYVRLVGPKSSQTGGMIISATGILYFGLLTEDVVASWDTKNLPLTGNIKILAKNPITNQWPDTFAIDTNGSVWWTTNRIQNFLTNSINLETLNYRVNYLTNNCQKLSVLREWTANPVTVYSALIL